MGYTVGAPELFWLRDEKKDMHMLRWILKTMVQGLVALIPIGLTLGLVVWLGVWLEGLFANPLKDLFPGSGEVYRMGMGIASFVLLMFLCGLMMKLWLVRKLLAVMENWLSQLPVVKTVFGAIKDVTRFFGGSGKSKGGDMVVMVTTERGWRQIGIVTRQEFNDLPRELLNGAEDMIAVYLPFSYQLGGYTYFMKRSECEPVPGMSVEDAMRYAMMAWLGSDSNAPEKKIILPGNASSEE